MCEKADLLPCETEHGGMLGVLVYGCVHVGPKKLKLKLLSCVWMAGCASVGVLFQ